MSLVYILKGENGRHYIGSTVNLGERVRHHFGVYTPSTKKIGRLQLVFSQRYDSLREARSIELKLKKLKRRDYIDNLIKDGFVKIKP